MSWSVMAARTRMWRRMVAIIRGENLGGAAWQRAQLERKRLSPSRCMFSFWAAWLSTDWPAGAGAAAVSFGASLLRPLLALAASPSDMAPATRNAIKTNLIFIVLSLAAASA